MQRIIGVLPYVLTVLGGLIGIAWVNLTPNASPVLGIAAGAVAGRLLAAVLVRLLVGKTRI